MKTDKFKRISVAHDLTIKQRAAVRDAINEAKQKNGDVANMAQPGTSENWVWRVVGHKRTPQVIKVKIN